MDNQDLYRQIIVEHYNNPQNKVSKAPEGYIGKKANNPSCGDEIEIFVKVKGNVVEDIKFNGEGCSICCSSASVMTQELIKNNFKDVIYKIENFEKMLRGEKIEEELFEDAIAYSGIVKFPSRYKCAYLGWGTILQSIKDLDKDE